jgi:tetratricopeptide (TPR) repeat protein
LRLEGGAADDARPALRDILSEDFESVLDAELGRALTDEMTSAAESAPPATPVHGPPAPPLDESSLFSDEQEFFNFAGELQTEMRQEAGPAAVPEVSGGDVPLEEIFREFKKGVEQQLSPEDYETHYNLGIAYKEMSLTDEAISEFQRAAKSPQYAVECCSMLGLCFLEKGLPQLAIKWYRKGLDTVGIREEDRLGLQYDLANLYADLGDRENAYRTFLEIYGSNASFRDVGERLKELAPA